MVYLSLCQRTADEGSRAETSCIIYSAMSMLHQVTSETHSCYLVNT